ncbi:MAG: hypothetical protein ACPG4T_09620, partial [Nannocystaceae bacterium]
LGQARLAHTLSMLGGYPWIRDPSGGAALSATLALMHRDHASAADIDWINEQLQAQPLRGAGLTAAGLLAACRDDIPTARALLRSVEAFDSERCPLLAWRIALEWQMADAASLGQWERVLELVQNGPRPSRTSVFLALVATRLAGGWVDSPKLVHAWIRAPHRLHNLPLLKRALAGESEHMERTTPDPVVDLGELAANVGPTPMAHAHALMLSFTLNPHVGDPKARYLRLVDAWQRAFDSEILHTHLSQRVLSLRASISAEELLDQMRNDLSDDLAALARTHLLDIGDQDSPEGSLLQVCIRKFRKQLLLEVESTAAALATRLDQQPNEFSGYFAVVEHWRGFLAAREIYERAAKLGGENLRRIAFPMLEKQLNRLALLALGRHDERSFADGIFRFLLWEAEALHNEVSAAAYRHNLAAGF